MEPEWPRIFPEFMQGLAGAEAVFLLFAFFPFQSRSLMVGGNNNNNNRRLVTLAEHTSDHGRQTNSSTEEKGEQV